MSIAPPTVFGRIWNRLHRRPDRVHREVDGVLQREEIERDLGGRHLVPLADGTALILHGIRYVMMSRLSAATMMPSGTQTVITRDMNDRAHSTAGRRAAHGRACSNAAEAWSTLKSAQRRPTI
jgi:hypothetical protein